MRQRAKQFLEILLILCICLTVIPIQAVAMSNSEIQQKIIQILYNGQGGYMSCDFDGYVNTSGRHEGIDFCAKSGAGTAIYSLVSGTVTRSSNSSSLSTLAIYDANNNKTVIYLHGNYSVSVGDEISQGQYVGYESNLGASAAHTHVEVRDGRKTAAAISVGDATLDNANPYAYWNTVLESASMSFDTSYAGNYTCTTTSANLNIRSTPSESGTIVGQIPSGDSIYVSEANGSWAHVTYNGITGYSSMQYLQRIEENSEAPIISNVHIFNLTSGGYYISCVVTDDQAVQRVTFATWTDANDQDDIIVPEVLPEGNLYIYQVKASDHNNESGPYVTHIYAYDAEGNASNYRASSIFLPKDYLVPGTNITLAYLEKQDGVHIVSCNQLQKDAAGDLVIPEKIDGVQVVAIDNDVFFESTGLTSVSIPEGVTKIGGLAFRSCSNLKTVSLPSTLASVGNYAFDGCTALATVNYGGDQEKWQTVTIGGNNEPLLNATFNYAPSEPDSIAVAGLTVAPTTLTLAEGETASLTATVTPADATNKTVTWTSSAPAVATVKDGTVTAVSAGTATITATTEDGGYTAICTVTVQAAVTGDYPVVTVSSARCHPGSTVSVAVRLSANTGISNMRLSLQYPQGFTLTSAEKGDALTGLVYTLPGDLTANPVNLTWDGVEADTTEGTIITLTFTVPDSAEEGEYPIRLSYTAGDILDGDLEDMELTIVNGTLTVSNFTYGDVNDDGTINMKDLGLIRRYLAGGYDMTGFVTDAADVNADGTVNMKDLGLMRRYLAGGYDIVFGQ